MKINWTKLYWPILALPVLCMFLGYSSNQAVLIANGGKFPVMVNEAQLQEHQNTEKIDVGGNLQIVISAPTKNSSQFLGDDIHSVMGPNSHLKFLADIWNIPDGTASLGDFLLWAGLWLWKYAPIVWITLIVRKLLS